MSAMATNSNVTILKFAVYFVLMFSFSKAIKDHHYRNDYVGGITTTLFHRDSPLSPFYDPSLTHYNRLKNAFIRSVSRSKTLIHRANISPEIIQSTISPGGEEFLMHLSIGTPPVEFVAVVDTGSDVTWIQCLPCKKCYNQSQPLFDPRQSSSYRPMPCTSNYCNPINGVGARCGSNATCEYMEKYFDESYTKGELGFEKLTIGSYFVSNTVFGCSHEYGGFAYTGSGLVGLGIGNISLVSQLNKISGIPKRFSYCFPTIFNFNESNLTGKLNFGHNANVSGPGVVSTPIVFKSFPYNFYYLTLEALSIGNNRLPFESVTNHSNSDGKGNIFIDSGTTFTYLPKPLLGKMVSILKTMINAKQVDGPDESFELCYAADIDIDIPIITAHFTGADVKLQPSNTFMKVADNVTCLIFASSDIAIFGNVAQMNFLIEYDLDKRTLSFKPEICA